MPMRWSFDRPQTAQLGSLLYSTSESGVVEDIYTTFDLSWSLPLCLCGQGAICSDTGELTDYLAGPAVT